MKVRIPVCRKCGASLPGARLNDDYGWLCPACVYKAEHPDAPEYPDAQRLLARAAPKQKETLF